LLFLLTWLYLIFLCALLLFTKGFLLKRIVINNSSVCEHDNWTINNLWNGLTTNFYLQSERFLEENKCHREIRPKFQRAILVIIDGLRYDFLQFNDSLTTPLPYQNKMKKLHEILRKEPRNGKLYKFEADPPTTTMQRIKGITTGSLPTFIDAGSNFNSYHITEDNILDHALRQHKNISFMGCSTWTELFQNHFHRKIPFSALNVKDLDTIDYGIIKHLLPEVKRSDWSILIAHFLGVDHCGHRYGTHHHEMARKLTEMDNVISDLTSALDDDTILFVMGDHGMTISGDHGGDSDDEVMAGLFTYSKKQLFSPVLHTETTPLPKVSQIDVVPTLSLLLDQPIPYSNLGSVIPDFYNGDPGHFVPNFIETSEVNDTLKELSSRLFKQINLAYTSYLNGKQLLNYINDYEQVSGDLPADKLIAARSSFEFLEEKYEDNLNNLISIDWVNNKGVSVDDIEESILELIHLQNSFQDFLQNIKLICRSIWAKFDLVSMSMGLSLMLFIASISIISPFMMNEKNFEQQGGVSSLVSIVGFIFCIIGLIYLALPFEDVQMSSFIVFIAASFSFSLWLLSSGVSIVIKPYQQISTILKTVHVSCVVPLCFLISLFTLFSNSYIIHEDTVTLYLCETFILLNLGYHFLSMLKEHKMNFTQAKGYTNLKSKLLMYLTSYDVLTTLFLTIISMLCLRWAKVFWFCREMQLKCSLSTYALPLAFLLSEFNEQYGTERVLLAVTSLIAITVLLYWYIKSNGGLVGQSISIITIKYFTILSTTIISIHWIFQLTLRHNLAIIYEFGYIQQIILPRIIYIIFILSLISFVYNPLFVHVIFRSKNQIQNGRNDVASIYNQLKSRLSENQQPAFLPPLVYGLQKVYSTSIISLTFTLVILTSIVLADGMTFPALMLLISGYCVLSLITRWMAANSCSYGSIVTTVLVWNSFSWYGFFGTSHQTTIPAVKYQAAYIGFKGSLPEILPQVMVLVLNTFSSQIICALALPLLVIFSMSSRGSKSRDQNAEVKEVDMVESSFITRVQLFQIIIASISFYMLRVSFAASSAAFHRRHLMVWKIFAPRFIFEAIGFAIVVPIMLLGYMYFLRIDNTLRRWLTQLEEYLSFEQNLR